jgi:hypothetical protein
MCLNAVHSCSCRSVRIDSAPHRLRSRGDVGFSAICQLACSSVSFGRSRSIENSGRCQFRACS